MDNPIVFWLDMLPMGVSNQKEHEGGFWTILDFLFLICVMVVCVHFVNIHQAVHFCLGYFCFCKNVYPPKLVVKCLRTWGTSSVLKGGLELVI